MSLTTAIPAPGGAKNRRQGPKGVYLDLSRFLRRDPRFLSLILHTISYENLKIDSDNFLEPFEISTPGGPTGLGTRKLGTTGSSTGFFSHSGQCKH